MLPFGVTIPATVPQGSEIPEGLMNNPVQWPSLTTPIFIVNGHLVQHDSVLKTASIRYYNLETPWRKYVCSNIKWGTKWKSFFANNIQIKMQSFQNDFSRLFPNIRTLPPFQTNYYQSLYCDVIIRSDLETWPCTYFYRHLLLDQSPY